MRENRSSIVVLVFRVDGKRNRGSVWKLENRASAVRFEAGLAAIFDEDFGILSKVHVSWPFCGFSESLVLCRESPAVVMFVWGENFGGASRFCRGR
jgi:hypothetical protein